MLPQILVTEPVEPMPLHHLIGHAHRSLAMKAIPGSRVMISGGWRGRWNPEREQGETQPEQVEGNRAEAVAVYPSLADVAITDAVADRPETITIDGLPIIDQLPGVDNLFFATGWSGHGWAIAPAINQLLADWVYSRQQPDLLTAFSYRRFLG
jgi:sarcosine oxidase subunit beta